jgi:hypothetical protein
MTLSTMTLSTMTLSTMTLSIMTLSIMTFRKMPLTIMTQHTSIKLALNIMKLSINL